MVLTINGQSITVLPRTAAMVQQLVENQSEIERHPSGCVFLDYGLGQVELSLKIKRSRSKIDPPRVTRIDHPPRKDA